MKQILFILSIFIGTTTYTQNIPHLVGLYNNGQLTDTELKELINQDFQPYMSQAQNQTKQFCNSLEAQQRPLPDQNILPWITTAFEWWNKVKDSEYVDLVYGWVTKALGKSCAGEKEFLLNLGAQKREEMKMFLMQEGKYSEETINNMLRYE